VPNSWVRAPICQLARKLIRAGIEPDRPLEAYRNGTLALRVTSLAAAARLTVCDHNRGTPRFVKYNPSRAARQRRAAYQAPVPTQDG
jgi:hypothetical protein